MPTTKAAELASGASESSREIVGPDGELVYPRRCNPLNYESEIAIVRGKRGIDLQPSQLEGYVWGVRMLADWSIRGAGDICLPLNFALPKNFDTPCSLGPRIAVGELRHLACSPARHSAEIGRARYQLGLPDEKQIE